MKRDALSKDLRASVVVFLVSLPFCLGVAAASGLSVSEGLVSGIVGGLVSGLLGGAPLQVSGPAVGLAAVTLSLVTGHGIAALGPVVMLAGLFQALAGAARLGGLARFVPASVVAATLMAAGAMQALCQSHVVLGYRPNGGFTRDLLAFVPDLLRANGAALALGAVTVAAVLAWERCAPTRAKALPAALVGVAAASALAWLFAPGVPHLPVPAALEGIGFAVPPAAALTDPALIGMAALIALMGSAESLMAGSATAAMMAGASPNHDRELLALGAGNLVCGLLGALPVAGVVVRSAANARAGAQSRVSTVLHGVWLLLAVLFAGDLLRAVPSASLAAILVLGGARLVRPRHVTQALTAGSATVFGVTLGGILAVNLTAGVAMGCACAAAAAGLRRMVPARTRPPETGRGLAAPRGMAPEMAQSMSPSMVHEMAM